MYLGPDYLLLLFLLFWLVPSNFTVMTETDLVNFVIQELNFSKLLSILLLVSLMNKNFEWMREDKNIYSRELENLFFTLLHKRISYSPCFIVYSLTQNRLQIKLCHKGNTCQTAKLRKLDCKCFWYYDIMIQIKSNWTSW